MQIKSYRSFYIITIIGSVLFIILSLIAMLYYPGGNYLDSTSVGYIFYYNYLSDLGKTVALNNEPNPVASILFPLSLSIAGVSVLPYFYSIRGFFPKTTRSRKLSNTAFVFGLIAAVFYLGVGFTPSNLVPMAHWVVMFTAFFGAIIAIALLIPAILLNPQFPHRYAWLYIILEFFVLLHVLISIFHWEVYTMTELAWQVVTQKLAVYGEMVVMVIQCIGAIKLEKKDNIN